MLFIALVLTGFLAFGERKQDIAPDHKIIFVLDINRTMNTKDVFSGVQKISRLQAAKSIIQRTIFADPQFSYGLILFNAGIDYIIPPTFDTGTFLLYLSGITTNLLPDGSKDFTQLSGLFHDDTYASSIIISDFDVTQERNIKFPSGISLLGLGSLAGDNVRYSNGILYYDNGVSVFSARNDHFATSLGLPYTALTTIDSFALQQFLFRGFTLPLAQRIFLYVFLGVLVIVVVLL